MPKTASTIDPKHAHLLRAILVGRDADARPYLDQLPEALRRAAENMIEANPGAERNQALDAALDGAADAVPIKKAILKADPGADLAVLFRPYATWHDVDQLVGAIQWEWPGWLPRGMMTMLAAEQESGKSLLALRIAAVFAAGLPWPDRTTAGVAAGKVLWVETEQALKLNLDRARRWGLPLENIVTPFADDPLRPVDLDDREHQAAIESVAQRPEVRLVVVDSLSGGHTIDENSTDMKRVMLMLAQLARETDKPFLVIHHVRKRSAFEEIGVTIDRVRGSSIITQFARCIWSLDRPDPNNESRQLAMCKSNIGRKPHPIGMEITDDGLLFGDPPKAPPRPESQMERATELIRSQLESGPKRATAVIEAAQASGLSSATLQRAKSAMKIVTERVDGAYVWSLPGKRLFSVV